MAHTIEKRLILSFFVVYIFFCVAMDLRMYYRIQNYSIRPTKDGFKYESTVPCDLNPFCIVTVKGLMLDYLNFYVLGPLAALTDRIFLLSKWEWLSPNYISLFHVLIACLSGKLISSKSLLHRRIGVVVYQVRSWLDDVDGLVARKRKHIGGEHSDVGSTGYYVDALCDSLGSVALIIGIYYYLKSTSSNRGRGDYVRLKSSVTSIEDGVVDPCIDKKKIRFNNIVPTLLLFTGTLIASSLAWNRYIDLYQNLLEGDYQVSAAITEDAFYCKQTDVIRSNFFWVVTTAWKLINPHALTDYILVAIFIDKLWGYIYSVRWVVYIVIFIFVYLSDFYYIQNYRYIWGIESPVAVSVENISNTTLT
ncbi:ceramide phosphoethanolamine synthase [Microplitis mediator]|uniref:ceramide phosphoethanolamine synthase n=1 Tax=Microplitis mediator TaxID=375433 RepID=UPI002556EF37|nr:ceramide phosphoethanolamine synthase [Microplitis mediator]